MRALRVSATDIDALRRYLNPPIPEMEIELSELLAQLRRELEPSESMLAGTALHAALETSPDGDYAELSHDGYRFIIEADGEIDLPAIREVKATREYAFGDTIVTLVGKVDAISGRRVDDHKFTSKYDAERFLNSFQWRVYLEVFGADEFRWNVFEGKEVGDKVYAIKHIHQLTTHRYPGLPEDVKREVEFFLSFAERHLPERFTEA